jgi:hypothetical protein
MKFIIAALLIQLAVSSSLHEGRRTHALKSRDGTVSPLTAFIDAGSSKSSLDIIDPALVKTLLKKALDNEDKNALLATIYAVATKEA